MGKKTEPFIKLMRKSQPIVSQLLRERPSAFLLLTQIALRTDRKTGQAKIGDFGSYNSKGKSDSPYRTDKKWLESLGLVKFTGFRRGTIALLLTNDVFDINPPDTLTSYEQATNKQNIKQTNKQKLEENRLPSTTKLTSSLQKTNEKLTSIQEKEKEAFLPIKEKSALVSKEVWDKTVSSYQNRMAQYRAQNKPVTSPKGLFLTILKSTAAELGDHKYLASVISDDELKAKVSDFTHEIPQEYFLEAKRRGVLEI